MYRPTVHRLSSIVSTSIVREQDMTEVIVRSQGGLAQLIETAGHQLPADEPRDGGGADSGPSPYELLLSALGACTAMTLSLSARRMGWELSGVEVRLRHDRVHAQDCAECETTDGYLDRIHQHVTVLGPLTEEQLQQLAEIVRKCPVHQALSREIVVEDSLSQSA
jgi:putative redox protein